MRLEVPSRAHLDAKAAPRGQLPYIEDDGETVGDSNDIVDHLIAEFRLSIDVDLTPAQRRTDHLLGRMLDNLYWVMSSSRWHDQRYWPTFRDEILRTHAQVTQADLETTKKYNAKRCYYQGIGRYAPGGVYKRGLADLAALASLLGDGTFMFGQRPHGADAACYGPCQHLLFSLSIRRSDVSSPRTPNLAAIAKRCTLR